MKRILLLLLLVTCALPVRAERVGVVLSGGGAKGLYHVGVIKALEENNIPIDYISGASMGAIVAGMYAAGYSPDEMIRFFVTDSVQTWLAAKNSDLDNSYYFKRFEPTPELVSIKLNPDPERNQTALQLPTNIISPYAMDLAFQRMLYPASAAAGNDFDSLMIPFRCNASDIYHKASVVFEKGSLPFAIRASMTIPLAFRPLLLDTLLMFDGGMYDNFPWQPLDSAFHPDIYIGSVCATNYDNPARDNIIEQASVMAVFNTDYSLPDSTRDVMIRRRFKDVGTLDYNRAGYIMARGYEDAMRQMPLIKERIERRVSDEEIAAKRQAFREKIKPLIFESIEIEGLSPRQTQYVMRQLGLTDKQLYDFNYFQRKYMQILAGGIFTGDFPEVTYNPETGFYRMKLKLQTQPSMRISLGGNISSTALNQGYAAFSYRTTGNQVSTYALQGFFGTFYNSLQAVGRHDLYTRFPFYIDYSYSYESYDYMANHMNRYYRDRNWRYRKRNDNYLSTSVGIPVLENAAFRGKVSFGITNDHYFQDTYNTLDKSDHSRFTYGSVALEIQTQSMNFTLYPTRGTGQLFQLRFVAGVENYSPGTVVSSARAFTHRNRNWMQFRYSREQYIPLGSWFTLGYQADAALSNHPKFSNPLVTAMWEPTFAPIPLMETMFMPEYRSPSFVGAGIIPVFNILNPNLYVKTYAYAFVPQEVVYEHGWRGRIWNRAKSYTEFVFGGSLVYQTLIGPASFTINKYTTGPSNWQFVFNLGYTLFSSRKY